MLSLFIFFKLEISPCYFTQLSGCQPRQRFSVPRFLFTDFISITWDLPFFCLWGCGCCYRVSHTWLVILESSGSFCALPLLCQSWLCFQGECKDLSLLKGTGASLSPLLLGRYSLLEPSSLSFRKHWGLNAIYSRCIRSQMLIFLWHIPEAFVLTEEINAAPDKRGSLLLCGRCTPPARGESGAVLIL